MRLPNLAYGVFATSPIANSRILALDTAAAERAPSVVLVMTPRNAPKLERLEAPAAVIHLPLQDERITYVRCVPTPHMVRGDRRPRPDLVHS